ncbi:MAG: ATP/GTP-binding protein [Thiocapsa sp.]|uniref:AAA family ATPase n=1 Tax=Thiocapsa sp. TaxID=2024551 RepID=UPI001BCA9672|nr:ATP/GTP-binding protein [Thiocapsa sp.]QVL47883.1 MAG: ATP/GTP-binding protein [Thiocapsa sp.]
MLLQFAVENYACFAEEALFSMVASAGPEHPRHLVQSQTGRRPRILRLAALYGANAHGKTKLIEALRFAQSLVILGTKSGRRIPTQPYRLDRQSREKPSRFDFLIDYEGVEYSYGFAVDAVRVHEEWLFVRETAREARYFERVTDADNKVTVEMGPKFAGSDKKRRQFLEFVAQGTRPNQLFLTEAVDRNVEVLKPLFRWFKSVLTVVSAEEAPQPLAVRINREEDFVEFMADFLRNAGTGIDGLSSEEEPLDFERHFPGVPAGLREDIETELLQGAIYSLPGPDGQSLTIYCDDQARPTVARLKTRHIGRDAIEANFDFEDESSGTQRLMEILPILADAASGERVYVVDELDRKLHPLLSRLFVSSFIDRCADEQRTQLVFTTHDTHLMDLEVLRRDEIWFFEKDRYGSSRLYSMNALKVRPDLKLEKSYLNGRFGGVPLIREPAVSLDVPC